jgi:iron-sulfur cluster assembly accessory protein
MGYLLLEVKMSHIVSLIFIIITIAILGLMVDYLEGLEGSRFVVQNPNATTTCGCGSSFSI